MDRFKLIQEHSDIFSNLSNYALVRNNLENGRDHFMIVNTQNNAIVLIEENINDIAQLMIEQGVSIYNSFEEAENKEYHSYSLKWDEEVNDWIKIYHKDL